MSEVNENEQLSKSLFKHKTQIYLHTAHEDPLFKISQETFKPLGADFANRLISNGAPLKLARNGENTPHSPQWPSRNPSILNSVQNNTSGDPTPHNLNLITATAKIENIALINPNGPLTKGLAERIGIDQEGEEEVNSQVGDGHLMINIWENVLLLSILYDCFTFAFFIGIPGFPEQEWMYFEILVEIIMLIDLVIRFMFRKTLIITEDARYDLLHGTHDSEPLGIAMYILSSIPSTIILYSSLPLNHHEQIWIALIRGLKLYRIKQLNIYFDIRDIRSKRDNFIRTVQASLYIILVTHLLACFWLFIGRVDPQQESNWMQLLGYNQYSVPNVQKYMDALFFAVISMTGLGLTPMYPRTDLEYAMHSFIMLLGVSLYVNFFAFFAVTIYKKNRMKIENMLKYEESRQMANLKGFSSGLRFMIRDYYTNLRLDFIQLNLVYKANFELPNSIREKISEEINVEVIKSANIFQFIDQELTLKLSRYLLPEMCQGGDFIMRRGEVANRLYFIKSGKVQICATDEKTVIAQQYQGSFFGEIGILIQGKRSCSVRAKVDALFLCIVKSDLLTCLKDSPTIMKYLIAVGRQRLRTTKIEELTPITINEPIHGGWLADIVQNQPPKRQSKARKSIKMRISHSQIVPKYITTGFGLSKWNLIEDFKHLKYFVVIPYSILFNFQSVLILVALFYNIVYVPYSIALDYDLAPGFRTFDYVQYLIYFGDTCLRPFLAIDEKIEILVPPTDASILLRKYVQGKFLFDMLATIPYDYIALISQENDTLLYKHFRLLRLFKLYRVNEILELAKKRTSMNVLVIRIALFVFGFISIVYWFNCMLIYVSRQEAFHGESKSRFDGQTMLSFVESSVTSGNKPLSEWSAWDMYANFMITATSFSITFGDVMPFTIAEEVLAIIQIIVGRLLMAFFFAEVSSYVGLKFTAYDDHLDQYNIVRTWLALNGISGPLRRRIDKYFATKWQTERGVREEELIQDLPSSMVANVHRFIFGDLIKESILLKNSGQTGQEGMIKSVLERLERIMVPKDEFIIKQGELADEMFFIIRGEVQIISSENIIIATLTQNMHFGEMALMEDQQIKVRSTSAIAKTNVMLAVLSVKNFKLIFTQYPEFKAKLEEIVKMRTNGLQQINKINSMRNVFSPKQQSTLNKVNDSDLYSSKSYDKGEISQQSKHKVGRRSSANEINKLDRKSLVVKTQKGKKKYNATKTMAVKDIGMPGRTNENFFKKKLVTLKRIDKLQRDGLVDSSSEEDQSGSNQSPLSQLAAPDNNQMDPDFDPNNLEDRVNQIKSSTSSMKSSYFESDMTPRVKIVDGGRRMTENLQEQSPPAIDIRIERLDIDDGERDEYQSPAVHMETLAPGMAEFNMNTVFTETDMAKVNQQRLITQLQEDVAPHIAIQEEQQKAVQQDLPQKIKQVADISQNNQANQIEHYLLQARMKELGPNASIVGIFFFYAFKYFAILPLSIYNIVFIPLQIGFKLPFIGWYLFIECLTVLAYTVDLFFIARMYFILKKRLAKIQESQNNRGSNSDLAVLSGMGSTENLGGSSMGKHPDWSDNERVERRFIKLRVDVILSAISICPFSLIFQDTSHPLFIINICRMLRMVKLLPIYRFLKIGKKFFNVRLFRLTEIMIAYYLLAHLISGIVLSIGLADKNFSDYYDLYKDQMREANSTSIIKVLDKQTLYIQGLYLGANALTHGTIGDINRVYEGERAWGFLQIWGLMFCYMLLFASISSIFRGGDSYLDFNQRMQHVNQNVSVEKLNDKTKNKINLYYDHLWNNSHGFYEQTEVLSQIPLHLRIDAMKERYQEAIENSIVFRDDKNGLHEAVVDSFLNLMKVDLFMPRDFLLKVGAVNDDFFFILEGEVLIVGLDSKIIGILRPGAHIHQDIGTGLRSQDIHEGKSIFHLISKTQITLGVVSQANVKKLFGAFPKWKYQVRKLNNQTQTRAKENLEEYLAPIVRLDPYCDEYRVEMDTIERHLTESTFDAYTEIMRSVLDTKENEFIYDQDSHKYRRYDVIRQHTKLLQSTLGYKKPLDKKLSNQQSRRSGKMVSLKMMHVATLSGKKLKSAAAVQTATSIQEDDDQNIQVSSNLCWANLQKYTYFSKFSRARTYCDIIHFLNLLYIAFVVPFFISFTKSIDIDAFFIFEAASLVAQALVVFVNMRTPVLIEGIHTLELYYVLQVYWQNGGLLYDLFGLLPINLAYGVSEINDNNFAYVGVLRFTRMISLIKMGSLFEKLQILMKNHSILIVVLKSMIFLLVLWHWTSCLWYFINFATFSHFQVSWFKKFKILDRLVSEQYLLCIYYVIKAVTGVGYPDMIAYNNIEKVIFILIINLGDALFAIAFGMIADLQMHVFESSGFQRQLEKSKDVEKFLIEIKADSDSRKNVENFHRYLDEARSQKLILEAKDIVGYMPESIVQEVLYSHYKDILKPLSDSIRSDNFMIALSRALTVKIFLPGDFIVKKEEDGKEMFFIIDGAVDVLSSDSQTVIRTLYPGHSFGEVALILGIKRIAHVKAKTFVLLSILQQEDMRRILENFPNLKLVFNGIAQRRLKEALKAEAKQAIRQKFKTLNSKWNLDKSLDDALRQSEDNQREENSTMPFFSTPTTYRDEEQNLLHLKTEPVPQKSLFQRKFAAQGETSNILGVPQQHHSPDHASNTSAQFGPQLHLALENISPQMDFHHEDKNTLGPSLFLAAPTFNLPFPNDDSSQNLRAQKSQPISRNSILHSSNHNINNNLSQNILRKLTSYNNSQMYNSQHSHISGNHPINARLSFQHTFKAKVAPLPFDIEEQEKDKSQRSSILVSPGGGDQELEFYASKDQEIRKEDVDKWPSFKDGHLSSSEETEKLQWEEKVLPEIKEETKSEIQDKDFNLEALDDQIKFISSPPLSQHDSKSPRLHQTGTNFPLRQSRDLPGGGAAAPSQENQYNRRSTFSTERRSRSQDTQNMPPMISLNDQIPQITIARPVSNNRFKRASTRIKVSTEKKVRLQYEEEVPIIRETPPERKKRTTIPESEKKVIQLIRQAIKNEEVLDEKERECREKFSVRLMKAKTDKRKGGEKRLSQIRLTLKC